MKYFVQPTIESFWADRTTDYRGGFDHRRASPAETLHWRVWRDRFPVLSQFPRKSIDYWLTIKGKNVPVQIINGSTVALHLEGIGVVDKELTWVKIVLA